MPSLSLNGLRATAPAAFRWAELQRWGSSAVVADSSAECCGETGEWSVCVAGSTEGVGTPGAGKTLQRLSVTGRWDP